MAEDSDDGDYDDREQRKRPKPVGKKTSHTGGSRPKKRRRRNSDDSGIISGSDSGIEEDESFDDSEVEPEPVETNEHGRPLRRAVKSAPKYEEPDSDEGIESPSSQSEEEVKSAKKKKPRQRLIVILKTGGTPGPPPRERRKRSGSYAGKHPPTSSDSNTRGTRRSSRIAHDDEETVVALTNSGNHVEVVRAGSKDPEGVPARAMKGGKGIKYPSKSTIDEEENSGRTKEEDVEVLEIEASQHEIMESDPQTQGDAEPVPRVISDIQAAAAEEQSEDELGMNQDQVGVVIESSKEDDEDDEDVPISRGRTRAATKRKATSPLEDAPTSGKRLIRRNLRHSNSKGASRSARRKPDESSDFAPEEAEAEGEENLSESSHGGSSPRKASQRQDDYESSNGRRSQRLRKRNVSAQQSPDSDEEAMELQEELEGLKADRPSRRRRSPIVYEPRARGPRAAAVGKDYRLLRPELNVPVEDLDDEPSRTPTRRRGGGGGGGGGWQRSLFSTYGPFGGAGGAAPVLGGPGGIGAAGGVDSDSSDDENMQRPKPVGGMVGMTPTSAMAPGGFGLFPPPATHNNDPAQATAGTPANLGKVKDKQALADADPLGVDQNVTFDGVGGLEGHIDQLKEMVSLPLLYPEIFMRFKITPPRGVLFHGPPGTGKTLLARALASSVSSQGKKVTFYMRKGADALSKWVGEAERQLRLLFEEARKNQPSIIFFDEIDGLAPVRSSKQEQIHASIVSTLLALMDGMDGRGQVVVIGATNRPDNIDPALRRPGRFDREFYFPLPNTEARRAILDIHTKGWNPPLAPAIKDELAGLTKGYGGADLRALCTEAALNAVQRRYPQIYKANEKLLIDPKTIEVTPKDFMISVKRMVPSSERSASSGASPLPATIEPLLRVQLSELKNRLADVLPQQKKVTALEEAQYEDAVDSAGFGREKIQQAFEQSRVFRPRLLLRGKPGMGQQYLAAALLNHFEGLHMQPFDLPTLLSDASTSPEATMVRLFSEIKMHKPSVIYIPNVQLWYGTVDQRVISTFLGLLRSLSPTDPVLLFGVLEGDKEEVDPDMLRRLFGYSSANQYILSLPDSGHRREFFAKIVEYIKLTPTEFPDPAKRKKRIPEVLLPAPPEPEKPPAPLSKEELKAQKKRDRQTLNLLKIRLQPIMDQIRTKYRKFRTGPVEENQIRYLYDETDPGVVSSDLPTDLVAKASFRPFEIGKDVHGEPGLTETGTDKFYYNTDSVTIEKRLSNGYYKRPKDFLADIKRLAKDSKTLGDPERLLKANELLTNVEVDIGNIEFTEAQFVTECEKVYEREVQREKEAIEKAKKAAEEENMPPPRVVSNVPHGGPSGPSTVTTSGPIILGEPMMNGRSIFNQANPVTPSRPSTSVLTNGVGGPHDSQAHDTNGSGSANGGNEADVEGDTEMGNTDSHPSTTERQEQQKANTTSSSSIGATASAQPRPFHSYTAPSQQLRRESGMSAPLSQTGALTPMPPGSQAQEFENEASTTQTTSGKKHSGPSTGEKENTQEQGPNLYLYDDRQSSAGPSQFPDTQGTQDPCGSQDNQSSPMLGPFSADLTYTAGDIPHSQGSGGGLNSNPSQPRVSSQPHSQPPVPAWGAPPQSQPSDSNRRRSVSGSIHALLNNDGTSPSAASPLTLDHAYIARVHTELTDKTSGFSVEQLEQVNSACMDVVWKTRGEWNRSEVARQVIGVCDETIKDMIEVQQHFDPSSWGRNSTQDS